MDNNNSIRIVAAIVPIVVVCVGLLLLILPHYFCYRWHHHSRRSKKGVESKNISSCSGSDDDFQNNKDIEPGLLLETSPIPKTESSSSSDTYGNNVATTTRDETRSGNKDTDKESNHFLTSEETWERAKDIFPELLNEFSDLRSLHRIYRDVSPKGINVIIWEVLTEKFDELREQGIVESQQLMKRQNAPNLCIALGMNKEFVLRRFEAIRNFESEFGIVGKTPIMDSLKHLVDTLHIKNGRFGCMLSDEDFDTPRTQHKITCKCGIGHTESWNMVCIRWEMKNIGNFFAGFFEMKHRVCIMMAARISNLLEYPRRSMRDYGRKDRDLEVSRYNPNLSAPINIMAQLV